MAMGTEAHQAQPAVGGNGGRRVRLAVPPMESEGERRDFKYYPSKFSIHENESAPVRPPQPHHLRRRSAVVGLSPNSSLSIGAVM